MAVMRLESDVAVQPVAKYAPANWKVASSGEWREVANRREFYNFIRLPPSERELTESQPQEEGVVPPSHIRKDGTIQRGGSAFGPLWRGCWPTTSLQIRGPRRRKSPTITVSYLTCKLIP